MLRRSLLVAGLALTFATCRDSFEPGASARIAVSPVLPASSELADFGLSIDGVRFIVVRPFADTLADTTVVLPPDVMELAVDIRIPILTRHDTVSVSVVALSGTLPLFSGTELVPVPTPLPPPEIALDLYVGPPADSIVIQPSDTFLITGDSLRFQAQAFNGGVPVSQFYVSWSTSDTMVARISPQGMLRAPLSRSAVEVRARMPSGAADSVTARFTPPATSLVLISGGGQTDTVGSSLSLPLEVEARANDGLGVGGVAVRFRTVAGGGSVADTIVITDTLGRARTIATLGSLLGVQSFEASATGLGSPVLFSATALAGPPAQLLAAAGDAQLAIVNTVLAVAPSVVVRDGGGNPVAGVPVTFAVTGGGGALAGSGADTTDASGVATAGAWTLGTLAGTNALLASGAGLSRTLTATGIAAAPAQLVAIAGDLQSALVGALVAVDPAVRVQDQFGNPVAGASVTFAVSGGGGSVSGAQQLTNAAGAATVGSWGLDTLVGSNTLIATVDTLSVSLTATGLADTPTELLKTAGDSQTAVVNTAPPTAPAVRLSDRYGNPVAGDTVFFNVLVDGGSPTNPVAVTDSGGVASAGPWTLATFVTVNVLEAAVPGVPAVQFTAFATPDVSHQLVQVSIDTQTALAGQAVSEPPAVQVVDTFFNRVPGVWVRFTPTGTLIGSVVPDSALTNSSGIARVASWTLATLPGLNTLEAAVAGLINSPLTFSANGITTAASTIAIDTGDGQTGLVGRALATPYSVAVKDAAGLPVAGVPVSWAAGPEGGLISPTTSTTDANGTATASRTLGGPAGTQTATATVNGLSQPTVTFTATALADTAFQIIKIVGDSQSGTVGTAVPIAPSVRVTDVFDNPIASVVVTFTPDALGGTVTVGSQTTDSSGEATAGSWTLGTTVGTHRLTASAGSLQPVTFSATASAGAPVRLTFIAEPVRPLAGNKIDPSVRVAFQDQFGNTNFQVTDTVSLGLGNIPVQGAKLVGTTQVQAVNGIAVFGELAIDSAGSAFTLVAQTPKVAGGFESQPFDVGGVVGAFQFDQLDPVSAVFEPSTGLVFIPGQVMLGVLDPGKSEVRQFALPSPGFAAAANPQTGQVFVTTAINQVLIFDAGDPSALPIPIPLAGLPRGIVVDEANDLAYVAVEGDPGKGTPPTLAIIDPKRLAVIGSIPFEGASGVGVAFSPVDRAVYVAVPSLGVAVFDLVEQKHVTTIPIVGEKGAAGTYGVAFDVQTRLLYATNRSDSSLSVIDPSITDSTKMEIDRVRVGQAPEGIGVDPDRGMVYVANSGSNTLSFLTIDPKTSRLVVIATLLVGPTPKAAAVDPGTGRIYVPTFGDDRVVVVQP